MTDHARAARDLRRRVIALVRSQEPDALERRVPATPDWRVRDVVAHLAGVCADIRAGNLDGVATDGWTAAQVAARRDRPIERVLEEWEADGATVEGAVRSGQFFLDASTHEHDLRGALGAPGARASDALAIGFAWGVERIGEALDAAARPALRLDHDAGSTTAGSGAPGGAVAADRFELSRAMTGRRSRAQVLAYRWSAEPEPERLLLAIFGFRATDLVE